MGKVFSVASPAARNALMSKEQAMPSLGVFFPGLLVLSGALRETSAEAGMQDIGFCVGGEACVLGHWSP